MSRPSGFGDLAGLRVGIWGYGVEGRATERRIADVAASIILVDDTPHDDAVLATTNGGYDALATCDVVLKSPGIPRRRHDVLALEDHGVTVTSALNLWFGDADRSRVLAVTGTKGKSTTSSLICFALRSLGEDAVVAGNIGAPPYDPDFTTARWVIVEVSSFQSVDIDLAPATVVVTSLGEDHLDWHGSIEQYHADKLAITRARGDHTTIVANDAALTSRRTLLGGDVIVISGESADLVAALGLLGQHNASNIAVAIAATAHVTGRTSLDVRTSMLTHAHDFTPLAGRLTLLATRDGVRYVDDGLATAPLPTIAALNVFENDAVALLVGGFDRGVEYGPLAEAICRRHSPTALITMPDVGERIAQVVTESCDIVHERALTMTDAVSRARSLLANGGVVLFSPAAPSFGLYANWRERSDDFARAVADITRS